MVVGLAVGSTVVVVAIGAEVAGAKVAVGANVTGAEVTGAEVKGAEVTGEALTGAEVAGAVVVCAGVGAPTKIPPPQAQHSSFAEKVAESKTMTHSAT